jgi:hypothetical protein
MVTFVVLVLVVLEIKPRVLDMIGNYSTTKSSEFSLSHDETNMRVGHPGRAGRQCWQQWRQWVSVFTAPLSFRFPGSWSCLKSSLNPPSAPTSNQHEP